MNTNMDRKMGGEVLKSLHGRQQYGRGAQQSVSPSLKKPLATGSWTTWQRRHPKPLKQAHYKTLLAQTNSPKNVTESENTDSPPAYANPMKEEKKSEKKGKKEVEFVKTDIELGKRRNLKLSVGMPGVQSRSKMSQISTTFQRHTNADAIKHKRTEDVTVVMKTVAIPSNTGNFNRSSPKEFEKAAEYFLGRPSTRGINTARRYLQIGCKMRTEEENRIIAARLKWMKCIPKLDDYLRNSSKEGRPSLPSSKSMQGLPLSEAKHKQKWFGGEELTEKGDDVDSVMDSSDSESEGEESDGYGEKKVKSEVPGVVALGEKRIDRAMDTWLKLISSATYEWFPENYMILSEDSVPDGFFAIISGAVMIAQSVPQIQSMVTNAVLGEGEVFGVDESLRGTPMRTSTVSKSPCECIIIANTALRDTIDLIEKSRRDSNVQARRGLLTQKK